MSKRLIAFMVRGYKRHIYLLHAYDGVVEKKTFEMPTYITVGGRTIKNVKIGWESYGTLNADKSNAILGYALLCRYKSCRRQVQGRRPGPWLLGPDHRPGQGPRHQQVFHPLIRHAGQSQRQGSERHHHRAGHDRSLNRQALRALVSVVTIRDFVTCRRRSSKASASASFTPSWAPRWARCRPTSGLPAIRNGRKDRAGHRRRRVGRLRSLAPRVGAADPPRPEMSGGEYYGKAAPVAGLSTALAMVALNAQHWAWTNSIPPFGRKWAVEGKDPASCLLDCKYAIEACA